MATESVAVPSNVIPFPAWRSEHVTWERRAREIITAASVEQIRLRADESDEGLCLVAAWLRSEARSRAAQGDATPCMLCVGADGAIELTRLDDGARIPTGYEVATIISAESPDESIVAGRLRQALARAIAAA